jgi:hypothetical protein
VAESYAEAVRRLVLLAAVAMFPWLLVDCGASHSTQQFTVSEVRHAFAQQHLRPNIDFDASTATDRSIARLAKALTPKGAETEQLLQIQAASFKQLRAEGISMLTFPSGSSDGDIAVFVGPDAAHAAHVVANFRFGRKRDHDNVPFVIRRRGNVVVLFPGSVRSRLREDVNNAVHLI